MSKQIIIILQVFLQYCECFRHSGFSKMMWWSTWYQLSELIWSPISFLLLFRVFCWGEGEGQDKEFAQYLLKLVWKTRPFKSVIFFRNRRKPHHILVAVVFPTWGTLGLIMVFAVAVGCVLIMFCQVLVWVLAASHGLPSGKIVGGDNLSWTNTWQTLLASTCDWWLKSCFSHPVSLGLFRSLRTLYHPGSALEG